MPRRSAELPRWVWLYLPFAIVVAQVVARAGGEQTYQRWMRGEISVPEIGTVVVALVAFGVGVLLCARRSTLPSRWLAVWIALFTLGTLFFAGEEASWGQHYFRWKSPEFFAQHNDQRETGLHNMSALLDQAPRAALTLCAALAVALPFFARRHPTRFGPGTRLYWIWPTYVCVPSALLALAIRPFEQVTHAAGGAIATAFDMQAGEFKEYFIAMMLMLYACSLAARLRDDRESGAGSMD